MYRSIIDTVTKNAAITTVAIAAIVAVAWVAQAKTVKKKSKAQQNPIVPERLPVEVCQNSPSGLTVDATNIRVADWGRWMVFAPKAIRHAIVMGIRGAEPILTHVMNRAHPGFQWPPPIHSPLVTDWQTMVWVISSDLDPDPQPISGTRPQLRVIR